MTRDEKTLSFDCGGMETGSGTGGRRWRPDKGVMKTVSTSLPPRSPADFSQDLCFARRSAAEVGRRQQGIIAMDLPKPQYEIFWTPKQRGRQL